MTVALSVLALLGVFGGHFWLATPATRCCTTPSPGSCSWSALESRYGRGRRFAEPHGTRRALRSTSSTRRTRWRCPARSASRARRHLARVLALPAMQLRPAGQDRRAASGEVYHDRREQVLHRRVRRRDGHPASLATLARADVVRRATSSTASSTCVGRIGKLAGVLRRLVRPRRSSTARSTASAALTQAFGSRRAPVADRPHPAVRRPSRWPAASLAAAWLILS